MVVKFNRNRLFDIEKVWVVVERFSEDKEGLYSKYLRDLTVYIRQLLKTKQPNSLKNMKNFRDGLQARQVSSRLTARATRISEKGFAKPLKRLPKVL